jgi:hypothetical protein
MDRSKSISLWSSVDGNNTLSLYSNSGSLIGSITGADLSDFEVFTSTAQVNINSAIAFDYVVASNVRFAGDCCFEFDNLAYYSEKVPLPPGGRLPDEGPAGVLLAVGVGAISLLHRWMRR